MISEAELAIVIRELDPSFSDRDIQRIFAAADSTGDGMLDYDEFLSWAFSSSSIGSLESWTPSGKHTDSRLIARTSVCPYGVLGVQMTNDGTIARNAAEPGHDTAILDPAGLYFIQESGPADAGGAAGVIYEWLGISELEAFPDPVRVAIKGPMDAKLHVYSGRTCIHAVGPKFCEEPCVRVEAIAKLVQAYCAVLHEFVPSGLSLRRLRLLSLSGGYFAGDFADDLPALTAEALQCGFEMLDMGLRNALLRTEAIEMCIFMESELETYSKAFGAV